MRLIQQNISKILREFVASKEFGCELCVAWSDGLVQNQQDVVSEWLATRNGHLRCYGVELDQFIRRYGSHEGYSLSNYLKTELDKGNILSLNENNMRYFINSGRALLHQDTQGCCIVSYNRLGISKHKFEEHKRLLYAWDYG